MVITCYAIPDDLGFNIFLTVLDFESVQMYHRFLYSAVIERREGLFKKLRLPVKYCKQREGRVFLLRCTWKKPIIGSLYNGPYFRLFARLGRSCVRHHYGTSLGTAIASFIGYCEVAKETGSRFIPQTECPKVQYDITPAQPHWPVKSFLGQNTQHTRGGGRKWRGGGG